MEAANILLEKDLFLYNKDLMQLEELMPEDEPQSLPQEDLSFELLPPLALTFDKSMAQRTSQTPVLYESSVGVGLETPIETYWELKTNDEEVVEGFELSFLTELSNDDCMETVLHKTLEDQEPRDANLTYSVVRNNNDGSQQQINMPVEAPVLKPLTELNAEVRETGSSETQLDGTNGCAPTREQIQEMETAMTIKPTLSNDKHNGDIDEVLSREELLKLRPRVTKGTRKAVPDELKDKKYYEKRSKGVVASRAWREKKRRIDEDRVALLKEKSEELDRLKLEAIRYQTLEKEYLQLQDCYKILQCLVFNYVANTNTTASGL